MQHWLRKSKEDQRVKGGSRWDSEMQFRIFSLEWRNNSLLPHMSCLYIMLIDRSEIQYIQFSSSNGSGVLLHVMSHSSCTGIRHQTSMNTWRVTCKIHMSQKKKPQNSYSAELDIHKRKAHHEKMSCGQTHYSLASQKDVIWIVIMRHVKVHNKGILYTEATRIGHYLGQQRLRSLIWKLNTD